MCPDLIKLQVGRGGFVGALKMRHPDRDMIESLPRLAKLDVFVICELHVHPLRRGRGWAGALLLQAQAIATMMDHDVFLWVTPYGNIPELTKRQLQNLYRRYGFEHVATTDESWYFWSCK